MNINELDTKLKEAINNNNYDEIIKTLEEMNRLIKKSMEKETDKEKLRLLEKSYKINSIRMLDAELKKEHTKNEELTIRGRLIKELKEYKKIAHPQEILSLRDRIDKEVEKHREVCKKIKVSKKAKIKIKESLGLKIQEISDTIKIFLSKHDIINKFKKVGSSTLIGGAFSVGMEAILTVLLGGAITPGIIVSSLPIMAYLGISSIVRNIITKTDYQKYQYKLSDEYKELIKKIPETYKEELSTIENLLKNKENASKDEKLNINKELIKVIDKIKNTTKVEEVSKYFKIEKHNLLLENKSIYESIIDNYLNDNIKLSKSDYQKYTKGNLKNEIALFESENAIKEATKHAAKGLTIDLSTLAIARALANFVIPGYKITSVVDVLTPLLFVVSNNLLDIIKYNGKIKTTKYNGMKVKVNNKEKLAELAKPASKVNIATV